MDSNEHHQGLEIQVLKSIYLYEYFESPPPKAWKGAARLPEFNIKVKHGYAPEIFFILNVKFPKAYPSKSAPILSITESKGLTPTIVTKVMSLMHAESQRCIGGEAIFQVISLAEDWMKENVKATREREKSLADAEDEKESQFAEQLLQQIEQDAQRKEEIQRQEKERQRARRRAVSDATEKPMVETHIETFDSEIEAFGLTFDSVRLYHGRRGTTYSAEPICDDFNDSAALELHVVRFEADYYKTQQGRKKIDQVNNELQRLTKLDCYDNILRIFADCDGLREDRVKMYLMQICSGLRSIHDAGLVHRAINPASIGLIDHFGGVKTVKLMRVAFHAKLHDLHRSEPFGSKAEPDAPEPPLSDDWLCRETLESPLLYTRCRDMHSVGVLVLQMLLGLDVVSRYPNPRAALLDSGLSHGLFQVLSDVTKPNKKSTSVPGAIDILQRLGQQPMSALLKPQSIPVTGFPMHQSDVKTPVARITFPSGSPETSFYMNPENRFRRASRWREDWEQLDVLGRGGFGSVVKARNLLDDRTYAVKKIRLRTAQGDNKIFREVNALSRLSHRYIVRYYTTWLEESEPTSSNVSSDDSEQSGSEGRDRIREQSASDDADDQTAGVSVTKGQEESFKDPTSIDLNDLVLKEENQTSSFPSIHFTSGDVADDSSDEEEVSSKHLVEQIKKNRLGLIAPPPLVKRTLYIQMEYVERQTLRERIAEGISEEEAWRLFQQITDALVHMASLGILHRDIKLTNIFIDSKGDCKVGDFGLATSSLAAVDPSDVSPMSVSTFADMTLDVGTRLYIAPEILSKRGGLRGKDHSKADLYSLGHDPSRRPTAVQLSQSPLLPPRIEDEYFTNALQAMTSQNNQYYPAVLASLFSRPPRSARDPLYDEGFPETAILRHGVVEHLDRLFRLHGARDVDVPLLMPLSDRHIENQHQVLLLDTHGEVLTLSSNALLPFARLAARKALTRIKRYHVADTYRDVTALSHPAVSTAAIFDIISPDTMTGLEIASAEMITLMDECLGMFPNLAKSYQIHVSHSKISEVVISRVPEDLRECVIDVLQSTKTGSSQIRSSLHKKGIQKTFIDEIEWLYEDYEDITMPLMRLEKNNSALAEPLRLLLKDVGKVVSLAVSTGLQYSVIRIRPLMIGRRHDYFKNGVCFEVVNPEKRTDLLAVGGRYDHLISQFYSPLVKRGPFVAVGLQIALERITSAIAAFQTNFLSTNHRSYDYWSARRCDVYVISFQSGYLPVRLEVASLLWKHGIRADLMYETGITDTNMEGLADLCYNEGILFTLYPKLKAGQQEPTEFKVKSVLRGTEYEIPKQDLIPWLQQQIAEQKKIDAASSGVTAVAPEMVTSSIMPTKESTSHADIQLILPGEGTNLKKQRKTTKQLFHERGE
ncbi:hypothetical protein EW145_g3398 [Phellinidium pouzarii]|uniref:non-specific serine/threonine protein kinase n=1 Tax=Phellinidium pouzarii TaxID=167371 RepID=A0A4S4L789_9AGAM|nr:hypothetical protein EW145_g3398 [Phellinidium pouzarii]